MSNTINSISENNNQPARKSKGHLNSLSIRKVTIGVFIALLLITGFIATNIYLNREKTVVIPEKEAFQVTDQIRFIIDLSDGSIEELSLLNNKVHAQSASINHYEDGEVIIDPKIIYASSNENSDIDLSITKIDTDKYEILSVEEDVHLRPGSYKLQVDVVKNGTEYSFEQDFKWGVLAVNTNKSVYTENENAKIDLAVLDEAGIMVCDADMTLVIIDPQGQSVTLSSANGSIKVTENCYKKEYVTTPDYIANYETGSIGSYLMTLTAVTDNGEYSIQDTFEVVEYVPLDVERITATRIYPPVNYPVKMIIKANEDFKGKIIEKFPKEFEHIGDYEGEVVREIFNPNTEFGLVQKAEFYPISNTAKLSEDDKYKYLEWNVDLRKGTEYQIEYVYKAPDISPEFYTLGPLTFTSTKNEVVFKEYRQWQIAADAIAYVSNGSTSSRNGTSASVTYTGTNGNLLIFTCGKTANAAITAPGGTWTTIYNEAGTPSLGTYYKISDGTQDVPSCSWTGNDDYVAIVIEYSGTDTTTPIDTNNTANGSGDTTAECASVTPSAGTHEYVAIVFGDDNNKGAIASWSNSFVEAVGVTQVAGPGSDSAMMSIADLNTTGTQSTTATSDGGNIAWRCHTLAINEPVVTDSWTGTVYTDDTEVTTLNSQSICAVVNNGTPACTTTDGSGVFTINTLDANAGEQITFYLDGGTNLGNTVTVSDGGDIVSGDNLRIYQNHVVVRHEQGTNLSILNMLQYDNDQNATDMLYDAELSTTNTLSVESTYELYVQSGYTFAPGGDVTQVHDIEIDGSWTAATSEAVDVNGTFILNTSAVLTPSTSVFTFDGTTGTEDIITAGTGGFYDIIINDGGNSLTVEVEDPLDVAGDLTITGGTLDVVTGENNQINVAGNWDNDDTFVARNGLVVFDGDTATTFTIDADGTGTDAFYDVTFNDNAGGATYQLTTVMDVDNDLTITGGTLDSNGNNITVGRNWTNDDIFTEGTATVTMDGTLDATLDSGCANEATCTNENFYNFTINKTSNGSVTLANTHLRNTNTISITYGNLIQDAFNIRSEGGTAFYIGPNGRWTGLSTGDVILDGNVNNQGLITLNGNGYMCGDADSISISSADVSVWSWFGSGTFKIADVDVQYQIGSAIIRAASSTDSGNNGANWVFTNCNITEFDGVEIEGLNID